MANPFAAVCSASQVFGFFGFKDIGKQLLNAIEEPLETQSVLTSDLGGKTTSEVGNAVIDILNGSK